ncbi:UNVERIFIED_CONTAM: putative LRR receptor-like serine/threonine-protein kinase [Sesamum calycinum]|uniref:LRR receptor-like serine/threonine-protein kinase n=1 Tax=Sesamum calycinum TaxID=2727403 RepID=A0AAW2RT00_9LAMI
MQCLISDWCAREKLHLFVFLMRDMGRLALEEFHSQTSFTSSVLFTWWDNLIPHSAYPDNFLPDVIKPAQVKMLVARTMKRPVTKDVLNANFHTISYFNFQTLKKATKNFNQNNLLGTGGFGPVYFGKHTKHVYIAFTYLPFSRCREFLRGESTILNMTAGKLEDGRLVAVKKLSLDKSQQGESEFLAEVKMITSIQHKNLVRLLGCCSDGAQRLLVYEYMKNRSLDRIVYGNGDVFLNWSTRFQIILGIARGLQYLHEDSHVRIVHRDIKASNILLDDKFQPRIGDFGLARFFPEDQSYLSTKFAGTLGYTAPEYAIRGELSEKADIYSFGVLVLEIISCRKNTDLTLPSEMQYLPEYAWKLYERSMLTDLIDPRMRENGFVEKDVLQTTHVAFLCLQPHANQRPPMSEIVAMLTCKVELGGTPTRPAFLDRRKRKDEKILWVSISEHFPSPLKSESPSLPRHPK